ncbi:hypothetical protein FNJ88_04060 [Chryseobacterium sp. SNU WT5]|uniref:hypothetical protein n=1 Tax=Chryseobacterium sp. SNU WT5 TaxID=2594269 RepID=UPI0011810255|nr:hypothetical protein [Chryseobacterium sp. SNU WT5]QDP84764.1 hypothetical protein FNJ88_04060 [Chryseobacterium sp. SNU WT5]
MKKLNLDFLYLFSVYLWIAYASLTILITFTDFSKIKKISWKQAENQSTVYSSRRSTTVTYNFVKDNVRISRKYPGILEGLNTWLWNINKKDRKLDISFYVREKDYKRILKNEIEHRKDLFGEELNEIESIPFFGLRNISVDSNKFLLILDLWKFNYSWWIFIVFLILPGLIIKLIKGTKVVEIVQNIKKPYFSKIDYIFWVLMVINIVNILI